MDKFKAMDESNPLLNLPPLESHSYIIEWLFDFGPGVSSGMGLCPVSYQEIMAWANGIDLTAWEIKTLRSLSHEYVSWSNKAAKKDCQIPYVEEINEIPSKEKTMAVSDSMTDMFRFMINNGKKAGLK